VGILLIVIGIFPVLAGVAVVAKNFINARQQTSNDAFVPKAWHNLRTDEVFPDHIGTPGTHDESQGWSRQGIAKEASCAEAFRADFAKSAAGFGCTTALRATYVNIGGGMAATLAIGVVGSYQQANGLAAQYDWAADPGPMVFPVAVAGTAAAQWDKKQAMAGGAVVVGLSNVGPPYVAAITVGPVDDSRDYRTLPGEWKANARGEHSIYWHVASELVTAYARQFDATMVGS
jgi:hypothetical protein